MSEHHIHPDLARWLVAATGGLPPYHAAVTRAEMIGHYEDALADYLAQGIPAEEAHSRVMADLGAVDVTANGLNDVYRGQRHYPFAALGSLLVFLLMFIIPAALEMAGQDTPLAFAVIITLRTVAVVYVTWVLRWLFIWRLGMPDVLRGIQAIIAGMILENGAVLLSLAAGAYTATDITGSLFQQESTAALVLFVLVQAGRILAGGSAIFIGSRWVWMTGGYGLGRPLAIVVIAMGVGLTGACLLGYVSMPAALVATAVAMISHAILWPLLTLLFFRAAFRSPVHPAQLA